jgi:hypothetical protein
LTYAQGVDKLCIIRKVRFPALVKGKVGRY